MEVIAPPILKETQSSPNFFVIVSFFIDVDTVPKKKRMRKGYFMSIPSILKMRTSLALDNRTRFALQ